MCTRKKARPQRGKAGPARMQRLDHGMGKRLVALDAIQGIAPPLHTGILLDLGLGQDGLAW